MASIETRHVNAWYGKTQALYDITLNVAERSVTALIGPSGCGKSTFVRHLNGVARGKAVAEQVELSLRQAALWEEVKHRLHTPATELSGGQQQRLCIARALALSPQVILMDEPCSALDPISTLQVEELIRQLKKDYTVIIVTHNMQQAGRIADITAFFLQGRLIEVGETKHFFAHPKLQETEDYLSGRFS